MEWDHGNFNVTVFQAAEMFARYIYEKWSTPPPTTSSLVHYSTTSSTPTGNRTTTNSTVVNRVVSTSSSRRRNNESMIPQPQTWNMILFISHDDRMVYIARPSVQNGVMMDNTIHHVRMQHLLLQEMMPYLQEHLYVDAVIKMLNGIDFYIQYGAPKFWERWFYTTIGGTDSFQFKAIVLSGIFLGLWTIFVWFYWNQLEELYQQWMYHGRLLHFQCRTLQRRMNQSAETTMQAFKLQERYQSEMCPICLEPFLPFPHTTTQSCTANYSLSKVSFQQLGSDGQPCTVLRCGHIYDTTCWTIWMKRYVLKDGKIAKCLLCQQEVE
jgi:hypothetical protein